MEAEGSKKEKRKENQKDHPGIHCSSSALPECSDNLLGI
nr:MAG TPA: hypothetical protein [Caudoviricetes sp.]